MTAATDGPWDLVVRPRMMTLMACVVAAVIAVAGIVVAVFNNRASGAILRPADQIAMAGLALILAGAVLVLTRPRFKAGPAGVAVRNLMGYRTFGWEEVLDVRFPPGKRWARIDLPYDEYFPVVAIQSIDRERAVAAMESMRTLMHRYQAGGQPG